MMKRALRLQVPSAARNWVVASLLFGVGLSAGASANAGDAMAKQILDAANLSGGLVVHLGCDDGQLTAALRGSRPFVVQGLSADRATVARARKQIAALGSYGPVSIQYCPGPQLPYADNLVNLLVVSKPGNVPHGELMRVLAPDGILLRQTPTGWKRSVKPHPDTIDDWTHYLHGADNNPVAKDLEVGPPRRLQWRAGPMWSRSHDGVAASIVVVLSDRGRLISVIDEGVTGQPRLPSRWTIVARDAFNGVLLWERSIAQKVGQKSLIAVDGRIYGAIGRSGSLAVLDAATGADVDWKQKISGIREMVAPGTMLVAFCQGDRKSAGGGSRIVAIDRQSGELCWEQPIRKFAASSLAATPKFACFCDGSQVVCMDMVDGSQRWQAECQTGGRSWPMMIYDDVVLVPIAKGINAYDLVSGKLLWTGPRVNSRLGAFGAEELVWLNQTEEYGRSFVWNPASVVTTGFNPKTGKVERRVEVSHLLTPGHHIRCYSAKATERFMLLPKRGIEFVDLQGEQHARNNWVRGTCRHGVVPANGLVYAPPNPCFCYPGVKLAGFNALAAGAPRELAPTSAAPLVRGPAYQRKIVGDSASVEATDWPMYRHDSQRSGHAGCVIPSAVAQRWDIDLGGAVTQPIAVGNRLIVASKNRHTVHCLDTTDGHELWHHIVGGRIDSSPSVYQGRVLLGSTDGWIYCLALQDGAMIWQFHAAPGMRQVVSFDQLESVWPAHGSVLIQKGVVYCTAGRSSFLDGGIHVYGLDPKTGEVQYENILENQPADVEHDAGRPFDMEGAKSDLLIGDGEDVYLYHVRFSPSLSRKAAPRITKLGDRKVSLHLMSNAGFLDTTWFDRNFWTFSRRWPGYYFSYNGPKCGQILVFDDDTTYGLHVFEERQGHSPRFWPGTKGYQLFADSNDNEPVLRPTAIGREKGEGFSRTHPPKWVTRVPVRMQSLVLAGPYLVGAGPPDVVPTEDPMAAFDGKLGGRLWIAAAADGSKVAEHKIDAIPVFDGLIAARGQLYLATTEGHVICFGKK